MLAGYQQGRSDEGEQIDGYFSYLGRRSHFDVGRRWRRLDVLDFGLTAHRIVLINAPGTVILENRASGN